MNRVLFSILAVLGITVFFSSCSQNSPEPVAKKWLNSFYHLDYETAKTVSTDETKKIIAMFQQLSINSSDSDKAQLKRIKVEIKNVKTEGDKSTVTYVTSDNPKEQTIHLVKQNGKWLVQWSKQDQMTGDENGNGDVQPADSTAVDSAMPAANTPVVPADSATAK